MKVIHDGDSDYQKIDKRIELWKNNALEKEAKSKFKENKQNIEQLEIKIHQISQENKEFTQLALKYQEELEILKESNDLNEKEIKTKQDAFNELKEKNDLLVKQVNFLLCLA